MTHHQVFAAQKRGVGPGMPMEQSHTVPDGDAVRMRYLYDRRRKWFKVPVMVSGNDLDVLYQLDKLLEKLGNVLPLFQLHLSNGVFDIAQQDKLLRASVLKDLSQLIEQSWNLRRYVYSSAG